MPDNPILIAGGGIGGLTTALALAHIGQPSILIEQRTRIDEVGAGIQLSPNASRILMELGLGPALAKVVAEPQRLKIRSGKSGKRLGSMPLGEAMQSRYGAPYWTIHRADVQTILLDAVRGSDHIRLAFGRTVAAIEDNSTSSVTIRCDSQSASERVTGKALIGADGIWSNVARLMGDPSKPEFHRHIAWRGLVAKKDWPADLAADETGLWLGPGAHLVHYPIRRGEFINLVAVTSDPDNQPGWSRAGEPSVLQKRFASWHPDAVRAIKSAQDWTIWSLYDRPPRTTWTDNRVVLLGDAAHPVLPFLAQGGALAIEDAHVLSNTLSQDADNPMDAFAAYAEIRKQRSAKIQAAARRNGDIYHLRWPFSIGRDLAMSRMELTDHYSWIYEWRAS